MASIEVTGLFGAIPCNCRIGRLTVLSSLPGLLMGLDGEGFPRMCRLFPVGLSLFRCGDISIRCRFRHVSLYSIVERTIEQPATAPRYDSKRCDRSPTSWNITSIPDQAKKRPPGSLSSGDRYRILRVFMPIALSVFRGNPGRSAGLVLSKSRCRSSRVTGTVR